MCPTLKYDKKYTLQNTNKPHNHATLHRIKSYPQFQTYPQESVENLENTTFGAYLTTTHAKCASTLATQRLTPFEFIYGHL